MKTIDQVKELKKSCYLHIKLENETIIDFSNIVDKKNYDFYNKVIAYLETKPSEEYLKKTLIQLNENISKETNKNKLDKINEQIKNIEFILN